MLVAQPALGQETGRIAHPLTISAGDLLDVALFDAPELSAKVRVNDRGEIMLPIGGVMQVQGLTSDAIAVAIEKRFREADILKDPHATVLVLEFATQGVTVAGEVKNPGIYPILGSRRLMDMIAAAGGVTANAGKAVTITHRSDAPHPEVVTVDSKPGSTTANVDVLPGDTIVVSKGGIVYVVGDVTRAGGFLIENNDKLTVLQAIALAQGTTRTAALNSAKLIRKENGVRQEQELPLKRILANKAPDQALQDSDIIFVPSSGRKIWTYKGVDAAIQLATGVLIYRR